jgi:hypothetical protein
MGNGGKDERGTMKDECATTRIPQPSAFRLQPRILGAIVSMSLACSGYAATRTIRLNAVDSACRIDLQNCPYPSAEGGVAQYAVQDCLFFNDALPAGSVVSEVDVKASIINAGRPGTMILAVNLEYLDQVDRWIGTVAIPDRQATALCHPPPHDVGFETRSVAGPQVPNGLPHYRVGTPNQLSMWTVSAGMDPLDFDRSPPAGFMEFLEITVHYEPPPRIEFDITDSVAPSARKILISRSRDEPQYAYPSLYQELVPGTGNADRDGKTMISGTVSVSGTPASNRTIYLRVADPPDPSLYLERLNVAGDNLASGGVLRDTMVTTDAAGRFSTVLSGSRTAGDNYRVQASTLPDFLASSHCDATNNCYQSGLLTMWKRIYVEKQRMLRNGMFLAAPASAGADRIVVRDNVYGGNKKKDRLSRGDEIVLVHAPQLSRADALGGWYMETHTILAVTDLGGNQYQVELGTGHGKNVIREKLAHDYAPDTLNTAIGDAIARINGTLTAADVFDARDDLVTGSVFPEAFVEYIYLSGTLSGSVPMPNFVADDQRLLQALADKWSSLVPASLRTPPNHQLLVIADVGRPDWAGVTISQVSGETSSWVFRGRITQVASNSASADTWAMKTSVHELAHQWKSNTAWGAFDHCPGTTVGFDSPVYCLLADGGQNPDVQTEHANGIARFHAIYFPGPPTVWHSEYLEIRKHPDPFTP